MQACPIVPRPIYHRAVRSLFPEHRRPIVEMQQSCICGDDVAAGLSRGGPALARRCAMAVRAGPVQQHFGIIHPVSAPHAAAPGGDRRVLEAFDRSALITDKMRVPVAGLSLGLTQAIEPDLLIAASAMEQMILREGVQRAIEGDVVGPRGQMFANLVRAQRLLLGGQHFQHGQPGRGAA